MTYKKLSDLTLDEIDNIIAKIEGVPFSPFPSSKDYFSPTTCWAHAGPIIDRKKINIFHGVGIDENNWESGTICPEETGSTALIAAMRYYVSSELGDTVEI